MTLLLRENDISELLTPAEANAAVERSLQALAGGGARNRPRDRVRLPAGFLHTMSAGDPELGLVGLKAYATFWKGKPRFHVLLYEATKGELVAILQAEELGRLRTGAASAIATKHLANPRPWDVGIIGTGYQASGQLECLAALAPGAVRHIRCFSRDAERRAAFAERMAESLQIPVEPVASAGEAVEGAGVVITITTSLSPVLGGADVASGAHVNAVGGNTLLKREIDGKLLRRAARIVTDSRPQAQLESAALQRSIDAGHLSWRSVAELGDVLAGVAPGRPDPGAITLFLSHGLALWDLHTAAVAFHKARQQGVGVEVDI